MTTTVPLPLWCFIALSLVAPVCALAGVATGAFVCMWARNGRSPLTGIVERVSQTIAAKTDKKGSDAPQPYRPPNARL